MELERLKERAEERRHKLGLLQAWCGAMGAVTLTLWGTANNDEARMMIATMGLTPAAMAYAATVVIEKLETGRWHPIPFSRGNFFLDQEIQQGVLADGYEMAEVDDWSLWLTKQDFDRYLALTSGNVIEFPAVAHPDLTVLQPESTAENSDSLPVVDIASEVVKAERSTLMVALSRGGKTTVLRQISQQFKTQYPKGEFWTLDPKGSAIPSDRYVHLSSPDDMVAALELLNDAFLAMKARQEQRLKRGGAWGSNKPDPLLLVIDELNAVLLLCDGVDEIPTLIKTLLVQGAEDNVRLIITAHTSRVEDLRLNTAMLANFNVVALARNGAFLSLEDCIGNRKLCSAMSSARLQAQLAIAPSVGSVAFSSVDGSQRLVLLPDYSTPSAAGSEIDESIIPVGYTLESLQEKVSTLSIAGKSRRQIILALWGEATTGKKYVAAGRIVDQILHAESA